MTRRACAAAAPAAHEGLREHGCRMSDAQIDAILDKDLELNAAGLAAWLRREGKLNAVPAAEVPARA